MTWNFADNSPTAKFARSIKPKTEREERIFNHLEIALEEIRGFQVWAIQMEGRTNRAEEVCKSLARAIEYAHLLS